MRPARLRSALLLLAVATAAPLSAAEPPLPPGAVLRLGTTRFRHHEPMAIGFGPEAKTVLSVSRYGRSLRIWETTTGRLLREFAIGSDKDYLRAVAFSRDGRRVAAASTVSTGADLYAGRLSISDVETGKSIREIEFKTNSHLGMSQVEFLPDGKIVAVNLPVGIALFEVETGVELLRYQIGKAGCAFAVLQDGKTIAVTDGVGQFFLWDWQSGEEPRLVRKAERDRIVAPRISPDGKLLAVISDYTGKAALFNLADGKRTATFEASFPPHNRQSLAFTPDGRKLLAAEAPSRSGKMSGGLVEWDVATGKQLRRLETPGIGVSNPIASADGRYYAATSERSLIVWDAASGRPVVGDAAVHRAGITSLSAAGNLILTGSDDHTARLWDAKTGALKHTLQHSHWVRGVAISPDGTKLATNALGDELVVWDAATGKAIYRFPGHGSSGGKREILFTPDGKKLLSYGDDRYARVTDLATGKATQEFQVRPSGVQFPDESQSGLGPARDHMLLSFSFLGSVFTPVGNRLIQQTHQHYHVFDMASGKEVLKIPVIGRSFSDTFAVSPDGRTLGAATLGKSIEEKLPNGLVGTRPAKEQHLTVFELASGIPVRSVLVACEGFGGVAYSPDGKRLAVIQRSESEANRISIRDAVSLEERSAILLPGSPAWSLTYLPDGRLAVPMADTTVLVFEVK